MKIVISQPMYLPWYGLFEQIRHADHCVHYDDVALPQGRSFISRVQLKAGDSVEWLSVPIIHSTRGLIGAACIDVSKTWAEEHRRRLTRSLGKAPFYSEVEPLLEAIVQKEFASLCALNIYAIEWLAAYLGFTTRFSRSSALGLTSRSSQRLLDICQHYQASTYITGHGARHYLDHALFEEHGVRVEYMQYAIEPYAQYGTFTPYVTILDLIAHTGKEALHHMQSTTCHWKEFLHHG